MPGKVGVFSKQNGVCKRYFFNLKKLKFYGGRELYIKAGGPDNPNTHFVLIL